MSEKHYLQYQTDPTVSYIMSRDKKKNDQFSRKTLTLGPLGLILLKIDSTGIPPQYAATSLCFTEC